MKNAKVNAITFAQAKDNAKVVVADRYVVHALYVQNKAIVEALGGTIVKGCDGFRAEFKSVKAAKEFISRAVTHISEKDYAKARKTEPKAEKKAPVSAPAKAKGNKAVEYVTVTLADGTKANVMASALTEVDKPAKAPKKAKATASKPTPAPKKASAPVKAPKKAKGDCPVDFSKLAGKGRAANKDAAALMRKAGYVDGTTPEYKAIWAQWCKVR